jgi:predicted short-subunit dehydrogenase-like oxidoreductase (DUF2520 family)
LSVHIKSISFAGAGNVATHLAGAFYKAGYFISGIYSPSQSSASALADKLGAQVCKSIPELNKQTDLIIVSVPDHAIHEVLEALEPSEYFIVHTSGGIDLAPMKAKFENCGVIYPLQTFSKYSELNLKTVPFCIEASDKELLKELRLLASSVSGTVLDIDSVQRRILHLSAVFAGNFTNSMYSIAEDILKKENLSFKLLHPLILETARKAILQSPIDAQTGPARRHDRETLKVHEEILEKKELYRQIYDLISRTIQEQTKLTIKISDSDKHL